MFQSKRKTEFLTVGYFKDWSRSDAELEALGRRLDAVRGTIETQRKAKIPENHWSLKHWIEIEQILTLRWKHTVRMKDVGLRQYTKRQTGPDIDYGWWEGSDEVTIRVPVIDGISRWITELFGNSTGSLDRAWERARLEHIEMARKGLA